MRVVRAIAICGMVIGAGLFLLMYTYVGVLVFTVCLAIGAMSAYTETLGEDEP